LRVLYTLLGVMAGVGTGVGVAVGTGVGVTVCTMAVGDASGSRGSEVASGAVFTEDTKTMDM